MRTISRAISKLIDEGQAVLQFINSQIYIILIQAKVIYLDYKPNPEISNSILEVI